MTSDSNPQKVKITNAPMMTAWLIGWLFSMGYLGYFIESTSVWEAILQSLVLYFVWPVFLGLRLAGAM